MDIENLLKELRRAERYCLNDYSRMAGQAATALSTLQAENEKLRNEVERQRRSADDRKHLYENAERAYMKVVAELEQVKAERDAAVSDLETIMAYNSDTCQFCKNGQCYVRGGTKSCLPKWRGQKEE